MEITKVACNRCVLLKKLNSIQSCTYIYANVVTEKIRRTIMNMKYKRKMDHANTFDNIYHLDTQQNCRMGAQGKIIYHINAFVLVFLIELCSWFKTVLIYKRHN